MTEDEILNIVMPIGAKLINKKVNEFCDLSYQEGVDIDKHYKNIPDLNPVYKLAIEHHDEVAVHANKKVFPYKILKTKAPHQSDEEWKYLMGIYEPVTFVVWGRAENKTKIIGNDQNFSIQGWDDEQKKYFYTDYPVYSSLQNYIFEIVRKKKANYPNQVMLIKPEKIPYIETDSGPIVDQSEKINYVVDIVDEAHTALFKENKLLVIISDEMVIINDRPFYQFVVYDEMSIWNVVPISFEDNKVQYRVDFVLEHGWGYVPAQKLKGEIQESYGGDQLFSSIFSFAIPDLNGAIRLNANLDMSENNAAFPTRIRAVDKCSYKHEQGQSCIDGKIFVDGGTITCPSCNGTGRDSSITPTGEIHVKTWSSSIPGKENILPINPAMQYVAPPVDIYTHLDSRVDKKMKRAFAFMFETEKATPETATGKQLEKEEFYSSLVQFSNELFGLFKFAVEAIGFFMFTKDKEKIGQPGSFVMPTFNNPTSFNFRDAMDLTLEISDAKKNNMPEAYILMLYKEYAATRFNSDEEINKFMDFMVYCDRLWSKNTLDINAMVGRTCTEAEAVLSNSFTSLISQCEVEKSNFWKMEFPEMKNLMIQKAEEIQAKISSRKPDPAKLLKENVGN